MRKLIFVGLLLLLTTPVWAHQRSAVPLNMVKYPLQVEGWAQTSTARVVVNINASLTEHALADLHQQMLTNLNKISAQGTWYITRFNQTKSQSGLESVSAQAEARLPADALAKLRERAKSVSQAGESYEINQIDFTPSLQDRQALRAKLRDQILQMVKVELARLNKIYPGQTFFVYRINFMPPRLVKGQAQPTAMLMRGVGGGMQVSDKIIVTARVSLASRLPAGSNRSIRQKSRS